jgi:hypothetical protein
MVSSQGRVLEDNHELTGKNSGLHDAEGSDCSRRHCYRHPYCREDLRASRTYRRRAGSRSAWWRASASADTRAYLASDRTEA